MIHGHRVRLIAFRRFWLKPRCLASPFVVLPAIVVQTLTRKVPEWSFRHQAVTYWVVVVPLFLGMVKSFGTALTCLQAAALAIKFRNPYGKAASLRIQPFNVRSSNLSAGLYPMWLPKLTGSQSALGEKPMTPAEQVLPRRCGPLWWRVPIKA